jgi:hypothetical protein
VIAPIGLPDSETRKRSDLILKHIIKPAVISCGYIATRADEIPEAGLITSQVIQRIVHDSLVIADLTEHNANVFYELALRHAVRKPLVQLIAKGERIPFDVANMRTITVDHRDLDSVESAKQDMIAQICAMEMPDSIIDSPISVSLDLHILRQSDKPQDKSLAAISAGVENLRAAVFEIEQRLDSHDASKAIASGFADSEHIGLLDTTTLPDAVNRHLTNFYKIASRIDKEAIRRGMLPMGTLRRLGEYMASIVPPSQATDADS